MFDTAEKLWGIKMVPIKDAPKYIDDMQVYDVVDAKTGEHIAVWWCDYFPRASKRQGAWMEQLQSAGLFEDGKHRRPIVFNVGNFTRPAGDVPALLTLDEVETTFHEFGHALQAILSRAPYKSLAGTNGYGDRNVSKKGKGEKDTQMVCLDFSLDGVCLCRIRSSLFCKSGYYFLYVSEKSVCFL